MAVVNRTTDSFYAAARYGEQEAFDAAVRAVHDGADVVDLGGVRAGRGAAVDAAEELRRVLPLVERLRSEVPEVLISVDTWRSEVARAVTRAGADLVNDTWAGHDPELVEARAEKPICWNSRALPRSQGLGSTKQPFWCSARNVARLAAVSVMSASLFYGL